MNWKKVVSVTLAGAVSGALVALSHALPPTLAPYVATAVSGLATAIAHKLDMWGSNDSPAS